MMFEETSLYKYCLPLKIPKENPEIPSMKKLYTTINYCYVKWNHTVKSESKVKSPTVDGRGAWE